MQQGQVQGEDQGGNPGPQTTPIVPPQYICVSDGDLRSQAVAERTGLKLRICPTLQAISNFVNEVGPDNVVIVFDSQPEAPYPVRFHEKGMKKVAKRVPESLISTGARYFVEVGCLLLKKSDRTSHVASLLVSAFVTHFTARVARGEYPWGKKPGTGRVQNKPKKESLRASRRHHDGGYGLLRPYVHG